MFGNQTWFVEGSKSWKIANVTDEERISQLEKDAGIDHPRGGGNVIASLKR